MISDPIRCEMCRRRAAKMVIVRRRGQDICRTFVCRECANERARLFVGAALDFGGIVDRLENPSGDSHSESYTCKMCGTTLADIVVDGRPGCCLCYSRFDGELDQAVESAQGYTYHVGKTLGE